MKNSVEGLLAHETHSAVVVNNRCKLSGGAISHNVERIVSDIRYCSCGRAVRDRQSQLLEELELAEDAVLFDVGPVPTHVGVLDGDALRSKDLEAVDELEIPEGKASCGSVSARVSEDVFAVQLCSIGLGVQDQSDEAISSVVCSCLILLGRDTYVSTNPYALKKSLASIAVGFTIALGDSVEAVQRGGIEFATGGIRRSRYGTRNERTVKELEFDPGEATCPSEP